ncbi:MAG: Hsp20/alpha crystallin family protein [Deltaproteobacteria bacterium]|nr:Hsp20/alpha crystallin family protein [Deltaproteobacteria bacterium]
MAEEKREIQHQSGTGTAEGVVRRIFVPKVDIYETRDAIVIIADMPGVSTDSVEVTLEKNILTIKGTALAPTRTGSYTAVYAECEPGGEYRRNFTISNEVDREKIEATVKNGVLRLTLRKAELLKVRKISVKAA